MLHTRPASLKTPGLIPSLLSKNCLQVLYLLHNRSNIQSDAGQSKYANGPENYKLLENYLFPQHLLFNPFRVV